MNIYGVPPGCRVGPWVYRESETVLTVPVQAEGRCEARVPDASWAGPQEPEDSQTRMWAGAAERCLFILLSSPVELPPRRDCLLAGSPQLPAGEAQRMAVGMNEVVNE